MSDKRTTPDPAERAPRRKRSAPTIDLTATEVPPAAADSGQPSEPPPAHEQPEAVTEPEAATDGWIRLPLSSNRRG